MNTMRFQSGRWKCAALLILFVITSPPRLLAGDDDSVFANFQRLVRAADPKLTVKTLKEGSSSVPSQADSEKLVGAIASAAVDVMDNGAAFEEQHPQSKHLGEVRAATMETLWSVFGSKGFPIPQDRLEEVEAREDGEMKIKALLKEE